MKYKQAILVRVDLKMGKGKIAAQVAHAAVTGAELTRKTRRGWWKKWMEEGQRKVVLKVKAIEDLSSYRLKAEKLDLPVVIIEDRGLTQVPPGEITCIAIGPAPSNKLDEMTGDLPLL